MELAELQNTWKEHDKMLKENIRVNKDILKNILTEKAERKIWWMKAKHLIILILALAFVAVILIPDLDFRNDLNFIVGVVLFGGIFITTLIWTVQYLIKLSQIDFRNSLTSTTKYLAELRKYKYRNTKLGYLFVPFVLLGTYMMNDIPFFTKRSILPVVLIIITMLVSMYITFKYSINESFKEINEQIKDIEKLEKE